MNKKKKPSEQKKGKFRNTVNLTFQIIGGNIRNLGKQNLILTKYKIQLYCIKESLWKIEL